MQDIDFLPARYHQEQLRRQSQPWRIVVVAAFALLLAAAVFSQHHRKQQAEAELAAIMPQFESAVRGNRQLAEVHARLKTARTAAELFTYLRHPWPRTQLLAAVLAPLPEEITLQQLQITRQVPQSPAPAGRYSATQRRLEDEGLAKLLPAARDLKRFRDQFDKMETVVLIAGTTSQSASLHRYLGELGRSSLFFEAELDSIESSQKDRNGALQFRATLAVRPGYGQPGGPTAPSKSAVAQADLQSRQ